MTYRDTMTRAGAHVLAHRINHFWKLRGYVANARVVGFLIGDQKLYAVRSDLVNGARRE